MGEEADGRQRRRRRSASYDDETWPQDGYPVGRRLEMPHDDDGEGPERREHVVTLSSRFVVELDAQYARRCRTFLHGVTYHYCRRFLLPDRSSERP